MRESLKILEECAEVQNKKSQDYQNPNSTVKQADYYVNGIQTIFDTMWGKMLRIKSLQEAAMKDPDYTPNHESLRDSIIDLINYSTFYGAYLNHEIPGQDPNRDIFNRPIVEEDYKGKY